MGRKVLVTGGAGFIGGHVAEAYIERGDRVWVVDDLSTGKLENVPRQAEFVQASVGSDHIDQLFQKAGGFDIVNHHAAQIDVRSSVADPCHDATINVLGLLNLLEAARRHGVGRFLFVSSGGVVYGEPEQRPTPELAPKLPLSPYGVSKLTSEYYLFYYHRMHGLDYVAQRYANVYGPRQDPHGEAGVVAIFSNRLLAGRDLTIFGDGEQTRDYVFVADVVLANLLLSDVELASGMRLDDRAFNVGTGSETSVNRLADLLIRHSGRAAERVHAAERQGELRHSCVDPARLKKHGWAPRQTLAEGLGLTYDYIKAKERQG
jgi:UDP-glucose 4-epimerase